jgi:hypothetical protein
MDHVRPIERAPGRPPVTPVPRVRRVHRDEDRRDEDQGRQEDSGGRRPPSEGGTLDVLA